MEKIYRVLGKRGRVTIPYEIRQKVGFSQNDVLSFERSEDGRTVTYAGNASATARNRSRAVRKTK